MSLAARINDLAVRIAAEMVAHRNATDALEARIAALEAGSGEPPVPDTPANGTLWVGDYDGDSVMVTAAQVDNVDQVRFAAVPSGGGATVVSDPVTVDPSYNFARTQLTGLVPDTQYTIRLRTVGGLDSGVAGSVKTVPAAREAFSFGFASCGRHDRFDPIYDTIVDQNPDFSLFYHFGDRHYGDINTNEVSRYHDLCDQVLAVANKARLHRKPLIYMWDDHDFGRDNSDGTVTERPAAIQYFRTRVPAVFQSSSPTGAVYRLHEPMPGFKVALLDTRSERYLVANTLLSAEQEAWLIGLIEQTGATADGVLAIAFSVPWIATGASDTWSTAAAQRTRIADAILANAPGRVFGLGGDMHGLAFDDGTNAEGGIPVYHAAPLGQTTSVKGGPYSGGTSTATETQYGRIDATPVAGGWTVRFRGYSVDGAGVQTLRLEHTATLVDDVVVEPGPTEGALPAILIHNPLYTLDTITGDQWTDASGNGRHAAITGTQGSRVTTGPNGMPFFMGATGTYAAIEHNAADNSAERTRLYWINRASTTDSVGVYRGSGEKLALTGGNTGAGQSYWNGSGTILDTPADLLPIGEWAFIADTFKDGTSRIYVGIGGTLSLQGERAATAGTYTERTGINALLAGANVSRTSDLAYSRVSRFDKALTEAELRAIYEA